VEVCVTNQQLGTIIALAGLTICVVAACVVAMFVVMADALKR
jgi:hypothetical protein